MMKRGKSSMSPNNNFPYFAICKDPERGIVEVVGSRGSGWRKTYQCRGTDGSVYTLKKSDLFGVFPTAERVLAAEGPLREKIAEHKRQWDRFNREYQKQKRNLTYLQTRDLEELAKDCGVYP